MTVIKYAAPMALLMVMGTAVAGAESGHTFKALDANGDGKISMQEAKGTSLEQRFAQLDANSNGVLTRQEIGVGGPTSSESGSSSY